MSTTAGQDARNGARQAAGGAGRWLHRLLQAGLAIVIVLALVLGGLAVRLAQGPLDVTWLARWLIAHEASAATHVGIEQAALTWEGLRGGLDSPLDLVLRQVDLTNADGQRQVLVPRAEVSLGMADLLRGRVALRSVQLDGMRLALRRGADGATSLDLGQPTRGKTDTSSSIDPALWRQLDRVRIHDCAADIDDRQLGLPWKLSGIEVDLTRQADGTASGSAAAGALLGGQTLHVDSRLALLPGNGGISISAALGRTNPAHLAAASPKLAPLAALDADLLLSGTVSLDAGMGLRSASLKAEAGAGTVHLGDGVMPIRAATATADATATTLNVHLDRLQLQARDEAAPTNVTATMQASRADGRITSKLVVDLDQVAFADLAALWPAGIGGKGTRPWITQNITAGLAHDGHFEVGLSGPEDLSDVSVTSIAGGLLGSDVTASWLRPVPPIEHGEARLVFVDPDTMDIFIPAGRQQGTQLMLHPSKVRLTGLAQKDQAIAITADILGPFADLIGLLHHPRIKILDRRPIPMQNPSGQVTGLLTVSLPLKNDLDMDSVAIHAAGRLASGHIGGIAAGRDIDRANLDYDVGNDGLKISGSADLAGIPSQLKVDMDFRAGGPSQVQERIGVVGSVTAQQLQAQGLDTQGLLTGRIGLKVDYFDRRDTTGDLTITGDLREAAIGRGRVNWTKTSGDAATLDAHVLLKSGRITSVDHVHAEAPGLSVEASADAARGRPNLVHVRRLIVGDTTELTGEIRFPQADGEGYVAHLAGASLDLSSQFGGPSKPRKPDPPDKRGTPYSLQAELGRVLLAGGTTLTGVSAHVENDGLITRNARLAATAGTGPVSISITPAKGGRVLSAEMRDAGTVLRGVDVLKTMIGGHLQVSGAYDDADPAHPLHGTVDLEDFRIRDAPAIGRILQAMSLYGLVEVAQGPGLGFTRMVAPFELRSDVLTLGDARAYSASLGLTAKGRIDLAGQTADLDGTVVPAYFFNSLLGRVPLVGRLFSPETGGGLFAVSYNIRGPLDDPSVGVNPLSALTPGFLRGFFDIFKTSPTVRVAPTVGEAQR